MSAHILVQLLPLCSHFQKANVVTISTLKKLDSVMIINPLTLMQFSLDNLHDVNQFLKILCISFPDVLCNDALLNVFGWQLYHCTSPSLLPTITGTLSVTALDVLKMIYEMK